MIARARLAAAALLLVAPAPLFAQATTGCVTEPEAEAVTLVAMPAVIRQLGLICQAQLPAGALLRQGNGSFVDRYDAASDTAWPTARAALGRVGGRQVQGLLQSQFTRPLLTSLLAPAIVGTIHPKDCGRVEHIAELVAPLPPKNTAGLIVEGLQLVQEKQAEAGDKAAQMLQLPICTTKGH